MYNNASPDYVCPFCSLVKGNDGVESQLKSPDIIFQTDDVTAFMALRKYPNNQGHVLVVPNEHFENIYDLPLELSVKIHALSRDVALAMKSEYHCDGIMLRQNNEPAGDQSIWHYHVHIIPRYDNDDFYNTQRVPFEADECAQYANKLRNWFNKQKM